MQLSDLISSLNKRGLFKLAAQLGGTAAGSPVLGAALGQIAGALGAKDPSPEALAMAIDAASPEEVEALRRIEAEMQARQFENEERLAAIEAADRSNARSQVKDERTRRILTFVVVIATLAYGVFAVIAVGFYEISPEGAGIVGTILGWLIRDASGANSFYFGTSAGSRNKEAFIGREMRRL